MPGFLGGSPSYSRGYWSRPLLCRTVFTPFSPEKAARACVRALSERERGLTGRRADGCRPGQRAPRASSVSGLSLASRVEGMTAKPCLQGLHSHVPWGGHCYQVGISRGLQGPSYGTCSLSSVWAGRRSSRALALLVAVNSFRWAHASPRFKLIRDRRGAITSRRMSFLSYSEELIWCQWCCVTICEQ